MSAPPEVVEVLRQWVRKAEHDLEAARRIMADEDACPYDTACFHCQQVIEKYLKALLTQLGIQAPHSHDLEKLAAALPAELHARFPAANLVVMNLYAVDIRYSDDWREPGRTEALQAFKTAVAIRAEARRLLPVEALD
jgi:HEPN domain-containing protein